MQVIWHRLKKYMSRNMSMHHWQAYCRTKTTSTPRTYRKWLLLFVIFGFIIYQQIQIYTLQEEIQKMNETLSQRVYHLEYIQDSHTSDLNKLKMQRETTEDTLRMLKQLINGITWRVMRLEWVVEPNKANLQ